MRQLAWMLSAGAVAVLAVACAPDADQNSIKNRQDAIAAFQVGRVAEAKALLERSLSWRPADPEALYYMGRIACTEQEWERAIGYFGRCIDVDPAFPTARQWLRFAEQSSGLGDKLRPDAMAPQTP